MSVLEPVRQARLSKTETGQVFMFPGSGTGGREAAIDSMVETVEEALVTNERRHA